MTVDSLFAVKASEIWAYFKSQDALFWLINAYLFMEYVRPQTLYTELDIFPYSQIILIITAIIFVLKKYQIPRNSVNPLILFFSLVILLSSLFAISPKTSFGKIVDFFVWVIIYFLIVSIVNTKERLLVFVLGFMLYSFKMSQFSFKNWILGGFRFSSWGTGGGPGWFHNSGEFGVQMCIFLSISFYFYFALKEYWPRWKKLLFFLFPLTALSGAISSSSRGALIGVGAVIIWIFLKCRYKVKGLLVLGLVCATVWSVIPQEQKARFETAGEDKTSLNRTGRWEKGLKMADKYPLLGVGFANWGVADRTEFGGDGGLSHNIYIECVSELGYTGFMAFMFLIIATFGNNHQTRKLTSQQEGKGCFFYYMAHGLDGALVGFMVSGFFVTVLYYPFFWINLSMTVALNNIAKGSNPELIRINR